jgi:catechol 2,3-dioxygenase-like lactoylglutathione lyase family enzyme
MAGIKISHLDHLVLTVADIAAAKAFYRRVLGMAPVSFGDGRHAVHFGNQKINLHEPGRDPHLEARVQVPGTGDLCFIVETPLDQVIGHLQREGVTIVEGPVEKTGATGPIRSVYFRDPDGNLIELSNPIRR